AAQNTTRALRIRLMELRHQSASVGDGLQLRPRMVREKDASPRRLTGYVAPMSRIESARPGGARMNVGLMFSFRNPPKWTKPWADVYESQLEQVRLAEELGYDTVWLTEHHFAEDGYS